MQQINWGIIGPGSIASAFAHSIQGASNSKLISVYGRNEDKTKAFANKFEIAAHHDLKEFIEDLTEKSLDFDYLDDLSNVSGVSDLLNERMNAKELTGSSYDLFRDDYIKLIRLYYKLYNHYIIQKSTINKDTFILLSWSLLIEFDNS